MIAMYPVSDLRNFITQSSCKMQRTSSTVESMVMQKKNWQTSANYKIFAKQSELNQTVPKRAEIPIVEEVQQVSWM